MNKAPGMQSAITELRAANDLPRIVQLIGRHWFAFAHFAHDRFGAAYFVAYRRRPEPSSRYVYSSKSGEHQRQHKGDYGQKTE